MGAICIYHTYTHIHVYAIIFKRFIDSCYLISDLVNCLQFDGLWPVLICLTKERARFFKWVLRKVLCVTVNLSFTHFIKIPQTLGWECAPTWNSTEEWTLPSKGQHEAQGHSSKHSCPLSTSHNPSFHPPCTPIYPPSCRLQEEVWLPPTGYRLPTYRQAGGEDTEETSAHRVSRPHGERPTEFYDSGCT